MLLSSHIQFEYSIVTFITFWRQVFAWQPVCLYV